MNITIFGSGYVGLVTGACLAEMGNHVICVDVDVGKVTSLTRGEVPIYEPGLTPLVKRNRDAGRLDFTTDAAAGVSHGEVIFIAVGTPPDEDGSADLQYVLKVAQTIGEHMTTYKVIVDKSTVPVGTAMRVTDAIRKGNHLRGVMAPFDVISNPEFLKEGDAVSDCMRPSRIVIGSSSQRAIEIMKSLYAPFVRNHERLVVMDTTSAELTKYAANAMLATKISFMNEIANIAGAVGADVECVRKGIGMDPRIGFDFIYPGLGYGGSCFPKDVRALGRTARANGYVPQILMAVERVNDAQKKRAFELLALHFDKRLYGKTIALWGLSFKPDTDDMREAPSRVLIEALWEQGVRVHAFDPAARDEALRIYGVRDDFFIFDDQYEALRGADALVLVTEWKVFRSVDIQRVANYMNPGSAIVDGRNILDPVAVQTAGIKYYGIGRNSNGVAQ